MRVYRPHYKAENGKFLRVAKWYVEFRDGKGKPHRIPAYTDKAASEELGRRIERIVEIRDLGEPLTGDLAKWVETLAPRMRERLGRCNVLDARRAAGGNSLKLLLAEFQDALRARERTEKWIATVENRARVTFDGCEFANLGDLDASRIERRLHALRSGTVPPTVDEDGKPVSVKAISARESNHRLQACREFSRWAFERGLVAVDPLVGLKPVNAALDPKHVRRALRPEDVSKLVQAAQDGETFRGVPGPVRALAWRLAAQAGLRVGEIVALQVRDVEVEKDGSAVLIVRATVSKNRTEARLPLAADLARDLAPYLAAKLPTASVLGLPACFKDKATRWLRHDMARADIEYRDASGRVADVHALRSAFVAGLVRSGANVKAIQRLARHSSPMMTLGIYARLDARDERAAIDGLPRFAASSPQRDSARATGTDEASHLPSHLPSGAAEGGIGSQRGAATNPPRGLLKAHAAVEVVEAVGIEPTSPVGGEPTQDAAGAETCVRPTSEGPEPLAVVLAVLDRESPELALIARSWPSLPQALRAAVLAIVRSTSSGGA